MPGFSLMNCSLIPEAFSTQEQTTSMKMDTVLFLCLCYTLKITHKIHSHTFYSLKAVIYCSNHFTKLGSTEIIFNLLL